MNYCFSLAVMKSISISAPKKLAKFTVERETGNKSESNSSKRFIFIKRSNFKDTRGKCSIGKRCYFQINRFNLSRICQELVYPFSKSS